MTHCSTEMAAGFRLTLPLRFASRLQKRPQQEVLPLVPAWRICRVVIDIIHPGLRQAETCLPLERKMGGDMKGRDGEAFPADLIFCMFPSPHHCWLAQEWQWGHRAGSCRGELHFTRAIANNCAKEQPLHLSSLENSLKVGVSLSCHSLPVSA